MLSSFSNPPEIKISKSSFASSSSSDKMSKLNIALSEPAGIKNLLSFTSKSFPSITSPENVILTSISSCGAGSEIISTVTFPPSKTTDGPAEILTVGTSPTSEMATPCRSARLFIPWLRGEPIVTPTVFTAPNL